MDRGRRPGIRKIGIVRPTADATVVSGWHLDPCAARCPCHYHPLTHQPILYEGLNGLGLHCFRVGGCDCCQPWTFAELAAIVRDLAQIESLAVA